MAAFANSIRPSPGIGWKHEVRARSNALTGKEGRTCRRRGCGRENFVGRLAILPGEFYLPVASQRPGGFPNNRQEGMLAAPDRCNPADDGIHHRDGVETS